MTVPPRHDPTGTYRDPVYTRNIAQGTPEQERAGVGVLLLVAYLGAVLTAFAIGAWIVGLVLATPGLLVMFAKARAGGSR